MARPRLKTDRSTARISKTLLALVGPGGDTNKRAFRKEIAATLGEAPSSVLVRELEDLRDDGLIGIAEGHKWALTAQGESWLVRNGALAHRPHRLGLGLSFKFEEWDRGLAAFGGRESALTAALLEKIAELAGEVLEELCRSEETTISDVEAEFEESDREAEAEETARLAEQI